LAILAKPFRSKMGESYDRLKIEPIAFRQKWLKGNASKSGGIADGPDLDNPKLA